MFLKFPRFFRVAALSILLVAELNTAFGINTPRADVDERVIAAAQTAQLMSGLRLKPGEAGIKHLSPELLVNITARIQNERDLGAFLSTCRNIYRLKGRTYTQRYRMYVDEGCGLEAFHALGQVLTEMPDASVRSYHSDGFPVDLPNKMDALPAGLMAPMHDDGIYLVHGGSPMHRRLREQMLGHGGALPEGADELPTKWRELTIFDLLPHIFPKRSAREEAAVLDANVQHDVVEQVVEIEALEQLPLAPPLEPIRVDSYDEEEVAQAMGDKPLDEAEERFLQIALSHRYGRHVIMCHEDQMAALLAQVAARQKDLCADLQEYVSVNDLLDRGGGQLLI